MSTHIHLDQIDNSNAIPGQAIVWNGSKWKSSPVVPSDTINVKSFGAVADGVTDDTAAIQAAVDSAGGSGSVYIPSGTYWIQGQISITRSNITIYGDGSTTWLRALSAPLSVNVFSSSADDVVIRDMNISSTSGRYLVTCINCVRNTFRNLNFIVDGSGGRVGIFVYMNTSDTLIENCKFYNLAWGGVATGGNVNGNFDGSIYNVTIRGCYFEGCGDEAIDINWDTHNVLIEGNTFIDNSNTDNECIDIGGGTYPHNCEDIIIVNNIFKWNTVAHCAVHVKMDTRRTLIANNTMFAPADAGPLPYGIFLAGVSYVTIANNNIRGFGRSIVVGSYCLYIKVIGNSISDPWGHLLFPADISSGRIDIENNTFIQTAGQEDMMRFAYGIFIKFVGNKIVGRSGRNCMWFNTSCAGPTLINGNQFIGGNWHLKVDANVRNMSISNNQFSRAEVESIYLIGPNDNNISISSNNFHEWSVSAAATGNYAIVCNGGSAINIANNTFYNDIDMYGYGAIKIADVISSSMVINNAASSNLIGKPFAGLEKVRGVVANNIDGRGSNSALTSRVLYDPPSLSTGTLTTTTLNVSGSIFGDTVTVGFSNNTQGLSFSGWVSSSDTVTIMIRNDTGSTVDLASGILQAIVTRNTPITINYPPIVNAGVDQIIYLPFSATLLASATDPDSGPNAMTYLWDVSGGPGTVTFTSTDTLSSIASFSASGSYVLRFSANDGADTGTDTLTILVNPAVTSGITQTRSGNDITTRTSTTLNYR